MNFHTQARHQSTDEKKITHFPCNLALICFFFFNFHVCLSVLNCLGASAVVQSKPAKFNNKGSPSAIIMEVCETTEIPLITVIVMLEFLESYASNTFISFHTTL